jgi:hypothetical protein
MIAAMTVAGDLPREPGRKRVPPMFVMCPPLARAILKRPVSDAHRAATQRRRAREHSPTT